MSIEQRIETGPDITRTVCAWTRTLAADEARAGALATSAQRYEAPAYGDLTRELFAELYGLDGAAEPRPGAEWAQRLAAAFSELPAWEALRASSAGDPWACGMGTAAALDALAPVIGDALEALGDTDVEDARQAAEDARQAAEDAEGTPGADAARKAAERAAQAEADAVARAQAAADAVDDSAIAKVRARLAAGAKAAGEEIAAVRDAVGTLGGVGEAGAARVGLDPRAMAERLRTDERLRDLLRLAGRLKAAATARKPMSRGDAPTETVGVHPGSDVARLLPSELLALTDPDMEALLYRRLLAGQALTYELQGPEERDGGPVVVCLDTSASMASMGRSDLAAAVTVALWLMCEEQGREFHLVEFHVRGIPHPSPTLLDVVEVAQNPRGSGTDIRAGLREAYRLVDDEAPKADVLLITDGESYTEYSSLISEAAAEREIATYAVGIGVDVAPRGLAGNMRVDSLGQAGDIDLTFGIN